MRDKLWLLILVLTLPLMVVAVSLIRDEMGGKDEVSIEQKLDEIDVLLTKLNKRDEEERQGQGEVLDFDIAEAEHSTKSGHLTIRGTAPMKKGVIFVRWVMYGDSSEMGGENENEVATDVVLMKPQLIAVPVETDGGFVVKIELPGMNGKVDVLLEQDKYRKQIVLDLSQELG